jgi:putative ABC transport system substrate-binding protein
MAKAHTGALLVVQDPMFFAHRVRLADLATRNRLPTMYGILEHVEAGGLMAYASNRLDLFRRAAGYADKIRFSRGASLATCPSSSRPSSTWSSTSKLRRRSG